MATVEETQLEMQRVREGKRRSCENIERRPQSGVLLSPITYRVRQGPARPRRRLRRPAIPAMGQRRDPPWHPRANTP
jgi:hypothetical protein